MNNDLAIVIPAYKSKFLKLTLDSIYSMKQIELANIYVFDDNSPNSLYEICEPYISKGNFKYYKYQNNYGARDLAGQWNRCVSDTTEEWVWLFSDDDTVDRHCLESFFNTIRSKNEEYLIYRFNTKIISDIGRVLRINPKHPVSENAQDYIRAKMNIGRVGFVTEFIFHRKLFIDSGGFVSFPKAWNSDDASWLVFGRCSKIYTISESFVYWRLSDINISSAKDSEKDSLYNASRLYIKWLTDNNYFDFIKDKPLLKTYYIQQFIYIYGFSFKNMFILNYDWREFWHDNFLSFVYSCLKYLRLKINNKLCT